MERREKGIGYHGKYLKGNCTQCHKEHMGLDGKIVDFDTLLFNHTLTLFPLEGKHQELKCEDCHLMKSGETGVLSFRWIGVSRECYQCHTTPHGGEVDLDCQACHTQDAWGGKALLFRHNRDSAFKLIGAHVEVDCDKCHPDKVFKPLSSACVDCHDDAHDGQLGRDCEQCHTTWKWKDARDVFDHDTHTSYTLVGAHRSLDCSQCHSVQYKGIPSQCAACHKDPHNEKWGTDCEQCHNSWNWNQVDIKKFNHGKHTDFPLQGKHAALDCSACHIENNMIEVSGTTCVACHTESYHKGELSDDCAKCHNEEGWKISSTDFNHATMAGYDIGRLHKRLTCESCHTTRGTFKEIENTCTGCHADITDFMAGISIFDDITTMPSPVYAMKQCVACHPLKEDGCKPSSIHSNCSSCHPSTYNVLSKHWASTVGNEAERLNREISALHDFIKRLRDGKEQAPQALSLSVESALGKLETAKNVLQRAQDMGYHNSKLSLIEIERAAELLEEFRQVLILTANQPPPDSEE
jgi:hypothetical protein